MWRRALKVAGAAGAAAVGLDRAVSRLTGRHREPFVLGYHRVVPEYAPDPRSVLEPMLISATMLEAHLDWVGRHYRFVSVEDLVALQKAGPIERPVAAVTVDDGYCDAYEVAFPLFRKKGVPAAFFVVTDLVGSPEVPLFDRLYYQLGQGYAEEDRFPRGLEADLKGLGLAASAQGAIVQSPTAYLALQALLQRLSHSQLRPMVERAEGERPLPTATAAALRSISWDQARFMAAHDMTIGSHTRNHVFLTRESKAAVAAELTESKVALEAQLGRPATQFAYPAGEFDGSAVRSVAAADYQMAYTCCHHVDREYPRLTTPRKVLWEQACTDGGGRFSADLMSAHASGVLDLVSPPCRLPHSL